MRKRGHIRTGRPDPITAMQDQIGKLVDLLAERDLRCGVTETETLEHDGQTITVSIHRTDPTRSLDPADPIERKLMQEIKSLEQMISPNAVKVRVALSVRHCTKPTYLELSRIAWNITATNSEQLPKTKPTWPQNTVHDLSPGELCHLTTTRTFSDTDPPKNPMPKHRTKPGSGMGLLRPGKSAVEILCA